jgi:glycosyltransferase involved in cell wall biosynthesis
MKRLKEVTPMDYHPPIYLVLDMLSRDEVLGLHKAGDCFVSLDRGEGFGLCGFEAGAFSKPIMVTGMGGAVEYAKPDNSYLIDYTMTPVSGMPWSPWYRGDQLWAEPDCLDAINKMRHIYNNQDEATAKGKALRSYIENNLTWEHVGQRMVDIIRSL